MDSIAILAMLAIALCGWQSWILWKMHQIALRAALSRDAADLEGHQPVLKPFKIRKVPVANETSPQSDRISVKIGKPTPETQIKEHYRRLATEHIGNQLDRLGKDLGED